MSFLFRLAGQAHRTPQEYSATDRVTFRKTRRLVNTHESVHSSVRIRMGLRGFGYNDEGFYDSQGLQSWTMEGVETATADKKTTTTAPQSTQKSGGEAHEQTWDGTVSEIRWVKKDPAYEGDLVMPEDELGELEREIMKSWPDVEKGFSMIRPGARPLKLFKSTTAPHEFDNVKAKVNGNGVNGGALESLGVEDGIAPEPSPKKSDTMQTI